MDIWSDHAAWQAIREHLERRKHEIDEEIRHYPAPIPACDAQFNRLLELRRVLPQELNRLDLAAQEGAITIDDFVRQSPCKAELAAWTAEG